MRAVVQRVRCASVRVDDQVISRIGHGLVVLIGFGNDDTEVEIDWMVSKVLTLRLFADESAKLSRSVTDIAGDILVVSQFTLLGDLRKGSRPDFSSAMPSSKAEPFYRGFMTKLRAFNDSQESSLRAQTIAEGKFAAKMEVDLVNDGPVTIVLDRKPAAVLPEGIEKKPLPAIRPDRGGDRDGR